MIRAAIVGCGGMGKVHSDCYQALQQAGAAVEVTAAVDIDPQQWQRVTSAHPQASTYATFEAFLAQQRVDIVHITTPSYLHASMAMACMQEGMHVFSEKPMALNLADAQCLCETSAESGRFLMVGQVLRFWETYRTLKTCVDDQRWGALRSLRLYRMGPAPSWDARGWFLDEALSGRAPLDLHLHDTDFIQYLLGEPLAVSSRIVDDNRSLSYIHTRYDYPTVDVRAEGGWVKASIPFSYGYEAIFDEAMLVLRDEALTLYPAGGQAQAMQAEVLEMDAGLNINNMGPYLNEIACFVKCVREQHPPEIVTPHSAMMSVAIVLKEIESARLRQTLQVAGALLSMDH